MTRKELVKMAVRFANGDRYIYKYKDLDDCYIRYSEAKSRAFWHDVEDFREIVIPFSHYDKWVTYDCCIPSHNSMMFTLFQVVYFWKDETLYAAYRYDSPTKTISGFFVYDKFKALVEFEGYDFDNFKKIYLDKIK